MEVWAANTNSRYVHLITYPILGASGGPGPKRREGDRQVPEGFYRLSALNPNSLYHLSIRVDYPNPEDIRHAAVPQSELGGDIYIHGGGGSVGCLAMGDPAIEEIFCLVALADKNERRILLAPRDFRNHKPFSPPKEARVRALYARLAEQLRAFPRL